MLKNLEIGPSSEGNRIPGFITVDIDPRKNPDYVADASGKLPFENEQFELVYASHIIEHIPWYMIEKTLVEWTRILKFGGELEVHTVNAIYIAERLLKFESGEEQKPPDNWTRYNPERNPYKWASGRIYAYDNGPSYWHKALFTPKYLTSLFKNVGLTNLEMLTCKDLRASHHGPVISFGIRGTK